MDKDKSIEFFSLDNLKRKLLPFLFTVMFISSLSKLYLDSYLNLYVLLAAVMTFLMYGVFDFMLKRRRLVSVPLYLLMTAAVGAILLSLLGTMKTFQEFFALFEWFMTGGETIETTAVYMLLIVIGFTFFIGSVSYYFTHVIYRAATFTLLSLVPCAIYVKAAQAIPTAVIIIMAGLNIALYVSSYRRAHVEKRIARNKSSAMTAYVDFTAAVILLAAIIPKPSTAPFYEQFEAMTSRFSYWGKSGVISGDFMEHSGNADEYLSMDNRLIYIISTDNPQYFKAQTFDSYDSANRYWICSDRINGISEKRSEQTKLMSLSELLKLYKNAQHPVLNGTDTENFRDETVYSAVVQAVNYPSRLLITATRTTDAVIDGYDAEILKTAGGDFFSAGQYLHGSARYAIDFYDEKYSVITDWLGSGLCNLTMEEYGNVLNDLAAFYAGTEDYAVIEAFIADYENALLFAPRSYGSVSPAIQSLANEITEGLTYDYEKAAAIESYFHSGKFRYDLAYKAPEEEDTPEFFLNESRKGTCSDFATAYCLLARAAGLTVRYAEGYVPSAANTDKMYYIYTENAHAYPEVYIPGAGWKIYEPTVSSGNNAANGGVNDETDYLSVFITCAAVFISILAVALLIAFMPQIEKGIFGLRLKILPAEKGILLVYGRFASGVERISGVGTKTLTSQQLGQLAKEKSGVNADEITVPFEKVCYGEMKIPKDETLKAYECSKAITKAMKKRIKAQRKQERKNKDSRTK